ncbi:PstS family phosphate ABC transporter substrate-binding protein [Opitutales bacterium ASA1]|uniref:phosphate ABC transporter substrate-binding protein n=1 Tax=Congregicoccus parvus TaxID=3081749 RepID=UPI002B2B77FB|nr:PstS family phosphate ABC transporter substrate-binding protein [Opitutales bacterium ASA1]
MKQALVLAAALVAVSASALSAQKIVIKGSDTLGAKLVPMLAEEYKATRPGINFEIAAEGSTTGIAAIIDGTAQIGMSSRKARPTEMSAALAKGVKMKGIVVSFDGLAVIVNQNNPVKALTRRQVEQIFTGDITDWSAIGGSPGRISIYTRNTSSGTYSDFKDLAMKKRDYAPSSQKMAGNEQIASEVAKNPSGIGYVGLAYINDPGIHVVSIDGAMPNKAAVHDESYPYARPNYFYTNGELTGEAATFVEFVLGEKGQEMVEKVGFVPIR